jgi:hypothetical protein
MEMEQATIVKVCHVESPSEFYVQEINELDNLQYFNDSVQYNSKTLIGHYDLACSILIGHSKCLFRHNKKRRGLVYYWSSLFLLHQSSCC